MQVHFPVLSSCSWKARAEKQILNMLKDNKLNKTEQSIVNKLPCPIVYFSVLDFQWATCSGHREWSAMFACMQF